MAYDRDKLGKATFYAFRKADVTAHYVNCSAWESTGEEFKESFRKLGESLCSSFEQSVDELKRRLEISEIQLKTVSKDCEDLRKTNKILLAHIVNYLDIVMRNESVIQELRMQLAEQCSRVK